MRLWVGGRGKERTPRIAARHADGFNMPYLSPQSVADRLQRLTNACEAEGRDYDDIELTTMWNPKHGPDSLKALEDLGIARVVIMTAALEGGPLDGAKAFAETYIG